MYPRENLTPGPEDTGKKRAWWPGAESRRQGGCSSWESVEDTKSEGRETPRRTCRERGGREGPLSPHHEHTHTSLARSCSLWKKSQGKAHGVSLSLPLLPEDRTRRRSTGWHPAYVSYPRTRQARPTGPLLHRGPGAWYSERWCEEQSQNWS